MVAERGPHRHDQFRERSAESDDARADHERRDPQAGGSGDGRANQQLAAHDQQADPACHGRQVE